MAHKRRKAQPDDAIHLSSLRWWALSIEKASMESFTADSDSFLKIRKILATAVKDIQKLQKLPKHSHQTRADTAEMMPQMMSEGETCADETGCNDPTMECCDGICVPRNACNIA